MPRSSEYRRTLPINRLDRQGRRPAHFPSRHPRSFGPGEEDLQVREPRTANSTKEGAFRNHVLRMLHRVVLFPNILTNASITLKFSPNGSLVTFQEIF
jgi:hypothetical protein